MISFQDCIVGKDYDDTFTITVPQNDDENDDAGADVEKKNVSKSVNITFLDAQHCPGSAM